VLANLLSYQDMNTIKKLLIALLINLACLVPIYADSTEHDVDSRSLNVMVSKLMSWYGSLIANSETVLFQEITDDWDGYRTQYPTDISQIQILKTDLTPIAEKNHYQFKVSSLIHHEGGQKIIDDNFTFNIDLDGLPKVTAISFNNNDAVSISKNTSDEVFNAIYYKAREFSYAWLAYMDGVEAIQTVINVADWSGVPYEINIGSTNINQPVKETLVTRKQFLHEGEHNLRLIDLISLDAKTNTYLLDLTLNWEGVNVKKQMVIAKINQKIELKIMADGRWQVISIKEKHLLPDLTPWQDLLC
jgi:hypothetical protein